MTDIEVRTKFGATAMMNARAAQPDPAALRASNLSEQAMDVARRFSDRPVSPRMVMSILRLIEWVLVVAVGVVALGAKADAVTPFDWHYGAPLAIAPFAMLLLLQTVRGYDPACFASPTEQAGRVLAAWTLLFAGFAVAIFFLRLGTVYSRMWFAAWYGGGLAALFMLRVGLSMLVHRWNRDGRFQRRAIIVGGGTDAAELIRSLEMTNESHIQICGIFDDRAGERSPQIVQGYPRLGTVAELVEFGRIAKIDMLIVSLPLTAENRLLEILRKLWVLPVDIRLSAHTDKLRFRPRSYSYIGAVPFLDVMERPIADWDLLTKRAFDLVFAAIFIVMLAPLLLATALAIKVESPGPVFFRQKRYGFNNELIDVLKFRSMYADKCDYEGRVAVTKGDPRVTRIGRIIRKTSIDELPQLFNVLRGNLSLVGPRPHAVGASAGDRLYESVVDAYFVRHKVKPGVTGWAQIRGWRGEVDTAEKLEARIAHDLHYIENWSPILDLRILFSTPFALFRAENAY